MMKAGVYGYIYDLGDPFAVQCRKKVGSRSVIVLAKPKAKEATRVSVREG
jgi:hypothetical protein